MVANVSVIIPAAGLSLRMKADKRKPYIVIGEKPIIFHTLEKFSRLQTIKEIILVVNKEDVSSVIEKWSDTLKSYKVSKIVPGGRRRQDSVYKGLCQIHPDTEIVLIHDAVRPQGFKRDIITKAYDKILNSSIEFTDDAAVVENEGYTIKIVSGSDDNIKITTPEDLQLAESLLVS